MKKKKIPYGRKVRVKLTIKERDLILNETFYDLDLLKLGIVEGKHAVFYLSLDDIENIQGYVAAEANHIEDMKLQRELDRLFDKFQKLLDSYDEQER